jgi:hypothetical protein
MRVQQQPPSLEVSTASALSNSLDRLEATVLGLFNGKSDLYEEFMVAANEMRGSYRYHNVVQEHVLTINMVNTMQLHTGADHFENVT